MFVLRARYLMLKMVFSITLILRGYLAKVARRNNDEV
jgi:hypothetical protein